MSDWTTPFQLAVYVWFSGLVLAAMLHFGVIGIGGLARMLRLWRAPAEDDAE